MRRTTLLRVLMGLEAPDAGTVPLTPGACIGYLPREPEIARLAALSPNVLLVDEPTHFLSLDVLEAFEAAALDFPGPVVVVFTRSLVHAPLRWRGMAAGDWARAGGGPRILAGGRHERCDRDNVLVCRRRMPTSAEG